MLNFFGKKRKFEKYLESEHIITGSENKKIEDVTVILNIWKREHLNEQLACLANQSVLPKEVWVIHYENHVASGKTISRYKAKLPYINLIKSDKNLKYFGRFSIALNVNTKFTWLIDDDVMPGPIWLENCASRCSQLNSIISCTGRIIPKNDYQPEKIRIGPYSKQFIGDSRKGGQINLCGEDTVVDYACNSYFYQSKWISAYWSIWPATFLSGEDIHLSASCKVKLDVNTIVLQQDNERNTGNMKRPYGWDGNASWKQNNFLSEREKVFRYFVNELGWRPLKW